MLCLQLDLQNKTIWFSFAFSIEAKLVWLTRFPGRTGLCSLGPRRGRAVSLRGLSQVPGTCNYATLALLPPHGVGVGVRGPPICGKFRAIRRVKGPPLLPAAS